MSSGANKGIRNSQNYSTMQLVQIFTVFFALVCQCYGLSAVNSKLEFKGSNKKAVDFQLGPETKDNSLVKPIEIDSLSETLIFSFNVKSSEGDLDRSHLLIGFAESGLETYLEPIVKDKKDGKVYTYKIQISKLPNALLSRSINDQEPLDVTLLLAKSGEGNKNIFKKAFQLKFSSSLDAEYEEPSRLIAKDEIYYSFRAEPKTAPEFIAKFFVVIAIATTVLLSIVWVSSGALSNAKIPNGMDSIYFFVLMVLIVGIEYVFTEYYLGVSIFETLYCSLCLGIPALIVGTKFLRDMSKFI